MAAPKRKKTQDAAISSSTLDNVSDRPPPSKRTRVRKTASEGSINKSARKTASTTSTHKKSARAVAEAPKKKGEVSRKKKVDKSVSEEAAVVEPASDQKKPSVKRRADKPAGSVAKRVTVVSPPADSDAVVAFRRNASRAGVAVAVGEGDAGQLGLGGSVMECRRFKEVSSGEQERVVDVCAGAMHSLYLTSDGQVFSFGCNDEYALGRSSDLAGDDNDEDDGENRPYPVSGISGDVVQLAAGDSFSAALTKHGAVYLWGTFRDSSGSIGLVRAGQMEPAPVRLTLPESIVQLAAGSNHLALLSSQGHVYTLGNGEQGQLGRVPEMLSVRGGRRGLEYLMTPDRVVLAGRDRRRLFDRVWAGAFCTVMRCSDTSEIYATGLNNYCQLSLKPLVVWKPQLANSFSSIKVEQFSGALHHSVCVDDAGKVYTLGRKEDGRLGIPALTTDVHVPTIVPGLQEIRCNCVSASGYTTMVISDTGDLYSWGMGSTGQLGLGDEEDRDQPTLVKSKSLEGREVVSVSSGGTHSLALVVSRLTNGH